MSSIVPASVALAALFASGCVVNSSPPPPADGSLTVDWTIAAMMLRSASPANYARGFDGIVRKLREWRFPVELKEASSTGAAVVTSLVGRWSGSPDCTLIFSSDDGKRVEGSCDNAGFQHKFAGDYLSPTKIRIRITRVDRRTGCSTSIGGELEMVDSNTIRVRQEGWNGCGVRTDSTTMSFIR